MNTDERALDVIASALSPGYMSLATAFQAAQDVLDDLGSAGIELFEAAPAQKESQ